MRRTLTFATPDDVLNDCQQLAAGPCTMLGQWTLAQNVRHLARGIDCFYEGFGFEANYRTGSWLFAGEYDWQDLDLAGGGRPIFHGGDQLAAFPGRTDIAVCLLPLTAETEGIFCTRTVAMMPKGAMLVNIGRGKHVVEKDLITALDSGQLSYAALDALYPEPLPPESPLWLHPKVTIMPHVARRPTVGQLVAEVAANLRSLKAGGRLLQEIDVAQGY